jgi:hemolysin activation/secretion protein
MAKTAGLLLALTLASTATAEQLSTPVVPQAGTPARLSSAPTVEVKAYRILGNTVFPAEELARVTQPWVKSNVTTEDLFAVRDALTRYYIQRGYINSGATVPDQDVVDGVIDLVITEGRLTRIDVLGARWFRSAYFEKRLSLNGRPLNVAELERGLQHLQQAGRGRRLSATLTPGRGRGESDLTLAVQERIPVSARLEYSNHQAPSIGGQRGQVSFSYDSLTGNGDVLGVTFGKTSGLEDVNLAYEIPVTPADTTIRLQFRSGDSVVIEEPFDAVDIASWSRTYSVSLSHPFRRRAGSEWTVGVSGDVRESKTWLLGRPFSFSEGAVDGRSKVAVIRGSQSWTQSTRTQVLAMRSQLSVGIDALGASINSNPIPDGRGGSRPRADGSFVSWLGQFQWARRLRLMRGTETIVRMDSQISRDPLLSLEQFAIGGHASVRGYRENQIVRDSGAVASVEARLPFFQNASGRPLLRVGPFADIGTGWNRIRATPTPKYLASLGVAAHASLFRDRLVLAGAWGHPLRDAATDGDLQDAGIHFSLSVVPW